MPKVTGPSISSQPRPAKAAPRTPHRRTPARWLYSAATPSSAGHTTPGSAPPGSPSSPKKGANAFVTSFAQVTPAEEHLWHVLYTNGACSNDSKGAAALAGVGVWSAEDRGRWLSERCPGEQTNNRAMLIALIRALEATPFGGKRLLLKTASSYAINCVYKWMPKWAQNGWKTLAGKPVRNQALLRYLAALLQLRDMRGKVRLQHVHGHYGDAGNDEADALARAGALLPTRVDEDWDAKLQDVQDQIDGELLAMADVHSPSRASASVLFSPKKSKARAQSSRPEKIQMDVVPEEDNEFSDVAGKWMEDLDQAELAKLERQPTAAGVRADESEFADADDPFADLTAEQLDALDTA